MSLPLTIEEYSEKAFVVRGDTKAHKEALMVRRGRYNPNLRGGPGWVFSKRHLDNITAYISEVSERKDSGTSPKDSGTSPKDSGTSPKDSGTSPSLSRKRKRVVNLEQYRNKLRKIIKKEVREEFEEQKSFVLVQWRNEFSESLSKKYELRLRRNRCLCTVKQLLGLFIFSMMCLLSFHLGKDGIEEYISIGWTNSTNSRGWCQVHNITATIPSAEMTGYKLFNHLSYPCW